MRSASDPFDVAAAVGEVLAEGLLDAATVRLAAECRRAVFAIDWDRLRKRQNPQRPRPE
jgi:hypothetical protein